MVARRDPPLLPLALSIRLVPGRFRRTRPLLSLPDAPGRQSARPSAFSRSGCGPPPVRDRDGDPRQLRWIIAVASRRRWGTAPKVGAGKHVRPVAIGKGL